jgi:hypothetical protein
VALRPDCRRQLARQLTGAGTELEDPLALQAASGSEPAAGAMLEEIGRQRLSGYGVMTCDAAATGQLAVSEQECLDVLWSTGDGALWQRLINERGWSDERFAQRLGDFWTRLMTRPDAGR